MEQNLVWKLVGTIAGQIVYYLLLLYAWVSLGWHAYFLGWIATAIACVVNPFLCAYLASRISFAEKKRYTVVVWSILFLIVIVCAPISNSIWFYASGYYRYLRTSVFNDTIAFSEFVNFVVDFIGSVISVISLIVSYKVLKVRRRKRELHGQCA